MWNTTMHKPTCYREFFPKDGVIIIVCHFTPSINVIFSLFYSPLPV